MVAVCGDEGSLGQIYHIGLDLDPVGLDVVVHLVLFLGVSRTNLVEFLSKCA